MLDPLILKVISIGFSLLFLLAALHKLAAPDQFRIVLQEYQLLPRVLVAPVARVLPVFEILLGAGWLLAANPESVAIASALLLGMYTFAIGINLWRGRIHIGCGCGVAGANEDDQQLSYGLIARNAVLILAVLSATIPAANREFGFVDYMTLVTAVLAGTLLYIASSQLLGNNAAIGAWRNNDD